MSEAHLLHFDDVPAMERGGGITGRPLIGEDQGSTTFCSGITSFPPGASIPMHTHNCDEQVTLLEGEGTADIEGRTENVAPYDTTFIPAGVPHRFINRGDGRMSIMWIYGGTYVTRTYTDTGETAPQFGQLRSE